MGSSRPQTIKDFDKKRYLGTWYDIMREKNIWFEKGEAVVAHYSMMEGGYIGVRNSIQEWEDKRSKKPPCKNKRKFGNGWAVESNPGKNDG